MVPATHSRYVEASKETIPKNTKICSNWHQKPSWKNCHKNFFCETNHNEKVQIRLRKRPANPDIEHIMTIKEGGSPFSIFGP